jgi:undecaprenyl-diphosphatase
MGLALILKAVIVAFICGVTEFLPVSSNGHVIILKELMGFEGPSGKLFEMSLQLGAISAVCWLYRAKLLHTARGITRNPQDRKFALNVIVACIPAVIIGALFHKFIIEHLFHSRVVACMLVAGGVAILAVEKFKPAPRLLSPDDISFKTALLIGLYQMLAMIPGVSRSGATIMGAMTLGVERKAATEFSFFLAIPMIFMAAFFDLFLQRHELDTHGLWLIAVGFCDSFVAAIIVVRWLLTYLTRHSFVAFAWYRIVAGSAVLVLLWLR